MALLGGKKPKTLSWETGERDQIVYRHADPDTGLPDTALRMGDIIVVREHQLAVFFRDGKVYDVFKPGRTLISTANTTLVRKLLKKIAWDNKSPFQAEVIFINTAQFQGKFGGKAYSAPSGGVQYQAELKFHGYYLFKVEDPVIFITEFFANRGLSTSGDIEDYARGFVNEKVINSFGTFNLPDLVRNVEAMTDKISIRVTDEAARIGLKMIDVVFEEVNIPEEARRFASGMGQSAMMMDYMKQIAGEVGGDEGGGAASVGFGGGLGLMMPYMMMKQMQQGGVDPGLGAMETKKCPSCGGIVPSNVKFCPQCGTSLEKQVEQRVEIPTIECPNCRKKIPRNVKFCPECGAKMSD